jgi:peptidoglycan/xylan/chitin deacetylase (PgdA/CDA1 family)
VMYHYVRELDETRYPGLNALTESGFRRQIDHLEAEYDLISMEDCIRAVHSEQTLPENPALLTFDDGLLDHYMTVFPLLKQRGIQGSFFPPAKPVLDRTALNVHKIHFILEHGLVSELVETTLEQIEQYQASHDLRSPHHYYDELAEPGRFDPPDVVFLKRALQRELDRDVRTKIVDHLFEKYMDISESVLADELYVTPEQLELMASEGMYIGSHCYSHRWLEALSEDEQREEIERSRAFLERINQRDEEWVMCYPYGSYNEQTLEILEEYDCSLGLTTKPEEALLTKENALTLSRLDTNDLPQ